MQILLESPLAVAAIGLLAVVTAGVIHASRSSTGTLVGVVLAIILTIAGVVAERLWLTHNEQVQQAVGALFEAIEANRIGAVINKIAPSATEVRSDAEVLVPQFRVQSAGVGGEVRVEFGIDPNTATAYLKPVIKVQHKKSGTTGAYFDGLELDFVRQNEVWLLNAYRPAKDWRQGASQLGR